MKDSNRNIDDNKRQKNNYIQTRSTENNSNKATQAKKQIINITDIKKKAKEKDTKDLANIESARSKDNSNVANEFLLDDKTRFLSLKANKANKYLTNNKDSSKDVIKTESNIIITSPNIESNFNTGNSNSKQDRQMKKNLNLIIKSVKDPHNQANQKVLKGGQDLKVTKGLLPKSENKKLGVVKSKVENTNTIKTVKSTIATSVSSKPKFSIDIIRKYQAPDGTRIKQPNLSSGRSKTQPGYLRSLRADYDSNKPNYQSKLTPIPARSNYRDNIEYKEVELSHKHVKILSIGNYT